MVGKRIFQLGMLLSIALLIQGCGFHLRGEVALPSAISPVHIQGLGTYDNLRTELTQLIGSNGISVAERKGEANTLLRILSHNSDRRTLSVDANGKVAEYELHEGVTFDLLNRDGSERVAKQSVSVIQTYINSEELALGKQQEESTLRREMQRDLANQILRHLQAQL